MAAELFMAKKKTAGSDTTPTPSNPPAAAAKRRAAPRAKTTGAGNAAAPAQAGGGPVESRESAPDMGPAAVTGAPSDSAAPYAPSFEQIAEEAYHRYLGRGGEHGSDFEDWLEAERRLRERQRK
jgi:hypothetical protein